MSTAVPHARLTDSAEQAFCPRCRAALSGPLYAQFRVCDGCRQHFTLPAGRRIELLVDEGSFRETSYGLVTPDPLAFSDRLPYQERLAGAREKTAAPRELG